MFRRFIAALLSTFAIAAFAAGNVDVNSATRADLESVKGIGPGLSGKIVDARKTAPFKDWNDFVERVGGVGAGNAAKFSQAGLTVGGARYDAAVATASAKPAKAKADGGEAKPAKPRKEKADKADKGDKA